MQAIKFHLHWLLKQSFSQKMSCGSSRNMHSESSTSLFARIHGSQPSRLQAQDWMLVALPSDLAPTIADVHLFGRGFFQVVFIDSEATRSMLKASPLPLGYMMIFLMLFSLGFDPIVEDNYVTSIFIRFLDLP